MGSQQVVVALRAMGFPHPFQLPASSFARSSSSAKSGSQFVAAMKNFQRCHKLLISCVPQALCKLHGVAEGFTLHHSFQQMVKLFAVQRPFSSNRLLLNVFCHRERIGPHASTAHGSEGLESNLAAVSTCRRSRPSQALPSLRWSVLSAENCSSERASSESVRIMM